MARIVKTKKLTPLTTVKIQVMKSRTSKLIQKIAKKYSLLTKSLLRLYWQTRNKILIVMALSLSQGQWKMKNLRTTLSMWSVMKRFKEFNFPQRKTLRKSVWPEKSYCLTLTKKCRRINLEKLNWASRQSHLFDPKAHSPLIGFFFSPK